MNKRLPTTDGTVNLLNVGAGDITLSFDPKNPAERIRAARIVKDMLRRGYALLVETEKKGHYTRALDFDEQHCRYIVADMDPLAAAAADEQERLDGNQQSEASAGAAPATEAPSVKRGRGRPRKGSVPAERARAVAVGPSAGG